MKKLAIVSLIILGTALAAVGYTVYNETNLNSASRLYEPIPSGYVVGKDNVPGYGMHHPGENCGTCHRLGGRADSHVFTMAGTIYEDRAAQTALEGGEIIMEDLKGNILSITSNAAGNFWTAKDAYVASDPYTVGTTHGGPPFVPLFELNPDGTLKTPANPEDSRTWKYKTWVRDGVSVRPMVSIAGIGGGTASSYRMSCTMHHGNMGSRGALWVSNAATLPTYPSSRLSYQKHIYPILRSKCSPCHIPGKTVSSANTITDIDPVNPTTVDFSAGLDLMNYDGSAMDGYEKVGVLGVVSTAKPDQSLLLRKASPGAMHGGGSFWARSTPDYKAIRQWIAEGAKNN